MRLFRGLFYIGPVVGWMAFIFFMSTGMGDAEHTIGLLGRLLRAFMPEAAKHFGPLQLEYLNYLIRKLGHFCEYMALTALAVRAFQFGSSKLKIRSLLGAVALSVCYAVSDEAHQYFVPYRTASVRDVLLDSSGALVCAALIAVWFGIKSIERRFVSGAVAKGAG